VIREKLTLTVSGSSHDEIQEKIEKAVGEYLQVESDELPKSVDIELDVVADESTVGKFTATAYVRVKN
jgi:hypothetical protein